MRARTIAALLVIVATTLSFGIFVQSFGLYYDDYPSWHLHLTRGAGALVAFASGQGRPLVGLLPALAGSVTGSHWLMYLIHTANGLLVLALLRRTWPDAERAAGFAAILFCVYPGYWLRPTHIALAIDGSLFLALLSLWTGLVAVNRTGVARAVLTGLSACLVPTYLLLYELPIGLELVRPALIALDRRRAGERCGIGRLLGLLAPWLVAMGVFGAWRFFLFQPSGDYARLSYNAVNVPGSLDALLVLTGRLAESCLDLCFGVWHLVLTSGTSLREGGRQALAAAMAGVVTLAVSVWAVSVRRAASPRRRTAVEMAGVGCLIVLAGQLAPLATGRVADIQGLSTRWALVSTLGAAMAWSALDALGQSSGRRWLSYVTGSLLVAMIGAGAYRHVDNAIAFAHDWDSQCDIWWQIAWRLGTPPRNAVLVIDGGVPIALSRQRFEYETTLSGELFFGADRNIVVTTSALAAEHLRKDGNPRAFELAGRRWEVDLSRSQLVLAAQGCLEVIDPDGALPDGKSVSVEGRRLRRWARAPTVDPAAAAPVSRALFGPEPAGWCRLYQAARRAEQEGDDLAVVRIGEDAWAHGLQPEVESEWEVFRRASRRARGHELPARVLR